MLHKEEKLCSIFIVLSIFLRTFEGKKPKINRTLKR